VNEKLPVARHAHADEIINLDIFRIPIQNLTARAVAIGTVLFGDALVRGGLVAFICQMTPPRAITRPKIMMCDGSTRLSLSMMKGFI